MNSKWCLICDNERALSNRYFCDDCEKNAYASVKETARIGYEMQQEEKKATGPNAWNEVLAILDKGGSLHLTKDNGQYVVVSGTCCRARKTLGEAVMAINE